jgi:hypothetical protein
MEEYVDHILANNERNSSFIQSYTSEHPNEIQLGILDCTDVITPNSRENNSDSENAVSLKGVNNAVDGTESLEESQNISGKFSNLNYKSYDLKSHLIYLADVLLSLFIFSPMVGFYWYGTWTFIDSYFFTANRKLSNFFSLIIGLLIVFLFYIFGKKIHNLYAHFKTSNTKFGNEFRFGMRMFYVYTMSLAIVFQWRGLWNLFDLYYFNDTRSQISLSILALTYFCLTRSTRTLIVTPFGLFVDNADTFFDRDSESRFKTKWVKIILF